MLDQLNTKRGEEWKHTDHSNFIRLKDFNGKTALHLAAERGNTTLVKRLLQLNVNILCVQYNECETALHLAITADNDLIV